MTTCFQRIKRTVYNFKLCISVWMVLFTSTLVIQYYLLYFWIIYIYIYMSVNWYPSFTFIWLTTLNLIKIKIQTSLAANMIVVIWDLSPHSARNVKVNACKKIVPRIPWNQRRPGVRIMPVSISSTGTFCFSNWKTNHKHVI